VKKVLIFGNSGSGKSTLAKALSAKHGLAHLDLDTLAWQVDAPTTRRPITDSQVDIESFVAHHDSWVIEGGYTDLLEMLVSQAEEIIFMNLPVSACQQNAENRPWEPHKYESKAAQDLNLEMLLNWIVQYYQRDDVFSEMAHDQFYSNFPSKKTRIMANSDLANPASPEY